MPLYEANIRVVFQVGEQQDRGTPDMVAQVWADGLIQGIRHNRPEVVGTELMVQRIQNEVQPPQQELPSDEGDIFTTEDRKQLGWREDGD
jgi:hypothetical protein